MRDHLVRSTSSIRLPRCCGLENQGTYSGSEHVIREQGGPRLQAGPVDSHGNYGPHLRHRHTTRAHNTHPRLKMSRPARKCSKNRGRVRDRPRSSQRNQKDQRIDYSLRLPNPYIRRVAIRRFIAQWVSVAQGRHSPRTGPHTSGEITYRTSDSNLCMQRQCYSTGIHVSAHLQGVLSPTSEQAGPGSRSLRQE